MKNYKSNYGFFLLVKKNTEKRKKVVTRGKSTTIHRRIGGKSEKSKLSDTSDKRRVNE